MKKSRVFLAALFALVFCACSENNEPDPYVLQKSDIKVDVPDGGFAVAVNQLLRVEVVSVNDEGVTYKWLLDGEQIAATKNLEHIFGEQGVYSLRLVAAQGDISFTYDFTVTVTSDEYVLQKNDIKVDMPEGGFTVTVNRLLRVTVESASDEGVSYVWYLDGEQIAATKNLEYMIETAGVYDLQLVAAQGDISFAYDFTVTVVYDGSMPDISDDATAYVTRILDFMPAVGQFVNSLPVYNAGDTQETMNDKVLAAIGNNARGMISLGGFGGYVVVGFDHTIPNIEGLRDFRVLGNAFYAAENPDPDAPDGGSCEPGVIMVAYDANGNGIPDDNEWYEIAGSAHEDPTAEPWYEKSKAAGNDVNLYRNYRITYFRPEKEPETAEEMDRYIRWEDNQGNSGYKVKNRYHNQCYFPEWFEGDELTFTGTCLPQNAIDESGLGTYYVLYKFRYGYADNEQNDLDDSSIDIDWAVNDKGQKVHLPGVDFIKIYCGINQENGWLGECSTEIMGVEDLHILGERIATRE